MPEAGHTGRGTRFRRQGTFIRKLASSTGPGARGLRVLWRLERPAVNHFNSVALHDAYRLSAIERRDARLEELALDTAWESFIADRVALDDRLDALQALHVLADLPERERRDLALAGRRLQYREIMEMTGRAQIDAGFALPHVICKEHPETCTSACSHVSPVSMWAIVCMCHPRPKSASTSMFSGR
jgi:hypothetical protein